MPIYSAGHSTFSQEEFGGMLKGTVRVLADVRSHPGSKWPQFQKENLEIWVPEIGIQYEWWPSLGGWDKRHLQFAEEMAKHDVDVSVYARGKFPKQRIAQKTLPTSPSEANQLTLPCCKPEWTNTGLRDYSWYESLDEFLTGADKLIARGNEADIAIMCCEALPWRCHRSMIADYLAFRGVEVYHIMGKKLKPHSSMLGNRLERYDEGIIQKWKSWSSAF